MSKFKKELINDINFNPDDHKLLDEVKAQKGAEGILMNFNGTPPIFKQEELEALKSDPFYGEKKYPNGDFYQGQLVKGRKHGLGLYTSPDSFYTFGEWSKGIPNGYSKTFQSNGDVDEYTMTTRVKNGLAAYYKANGTVRFGLNHNNK